MTNKEMVNKALDVVRQHKTVYANGMFGSPITQGIIDQKTRQLPGWYTADRQARLRALIGKDYFGFDCICFIKGLLWGWNGDASKSYGGAVYQANGVPDITEKQMLDKCSDVSGDFSNIVVGEYLYTDGHCGLYIGDGLAVECTPAWKNGVQVTAVANIASKSGYNSRTWLKHGKMPYVTYIADVVPEAPKTSGNPVAITLDTLRQGERRGDPQIATVQRILKLMGYYTMDIDASFGTGTLKAIKDFQQAKGLAIDGVVGQQTWNALLK